MSPRASGIARDFVNGGFAASRGSTARAHPNARSATTSDPRHAHRPARFRPGACGRTCWERIVTCQSQRVTRLCVEAPCLSRPFSRMRGRRLATAAAVVIVMLFSDAAAGTNSHGTSKVRFVDYSPEAFETARRERKPVFLLISAVWCYWCKYFDRNTLESDEVATYLNRNYLSIFVDHDRRIDLTRRYARGLPMIVFFGPDGQVRQSFAGALAKGDFLDVLKRVADDVRTQVAAEPPRGV